MYGRVDMLSHLCEMYDGIDFEWELLYSYNSLP